MREVSDEGNDRFGCEFVEEFLRHHGFSHLGGGDGCNRVREDTVLFAREGKGEISDWTEREVKLETKVALRESSREGEVKLTLAPSRARVRANPIKPILAAE